MTRKNSTPTPTPAVTGPAHRADGRQALRGPALALTGDVLPVGTLAGDDVSSAVAQAWLAYTGERFAPTSLVKWVRLSYVMIRGDHGKAQPRASVAALDGTPLGTPWLTVCHHGTALRVPYGNQAEDAGRQRTAWCKACEAGRPATIPGLPGAVPVPAPAPAKAPAKATRKAPTRKAPTAKAPAPAPAPEATPAPAPEAPASE